MKKLSSLFVCIAVAMSMMLLGTTNVSAKSKRQSYMMVWRTTQKWSVSVYKVNNDVIDDVTYIGKKEINAYEKNKKARIDSRNLKSAIKWKSDTWLAKKTSSQKGKVTVYKCKIRFTSNVNPNYQRTATVTKTVTARKCLRPIIEVAFSVVMIFFLALYVDKLILILEYPFDDDDILQDPRG